MTTQLPTDLDERTEPRDQTPRGALRELTVVEARRLLRHPAVWLGFAFSAAFAWALLRGRLPVVTADIARLAATTGPLAVGTLLATNLGILRPSRDDTEDVYGSAPVGVATRSAAMLGASLAAGLLGMLYAAAGLVYMYAIGGTGTPHVADVLAVPLLVTSAGIVGVGVARWFPKTFAGPLSAAVFVGLQLWFAGGAGRRPRLAFTSDWSAALNAMFDLVPRDPWIHLLYLAGIATALAAGAMLRLGPIRVPGVGLLVGTVTTVATGLALLQPVPPEQADLLLALANQPDALSRHNQCVTRGQISYCTPPTYHGWIDHWHPTVSAAIEALPKAAQPGSFMVRMHFDIPVGDVRPHLPDGYTARAEDGAGAGEAADLPRSGRGEILVTPDQYRGRSGDDQTLALSVAAITDMLGIGGPSPASTPHPDDKEQHDEPAEEAAGVGLAHCTPAGQAREIIALYLATTYNPAATRALHRELKTQPYALRAISGSFGGGFFLDDTLYLQGEAGDASQAIEWSRSGATLALRLLDLPRSVVLPDIHNAWEKWTDPTTTRDELVEGFDLEPLPTIERLAERAGADATQLDEETLIASASDAPPCL